MNEGAVSSSALHGTEGGGPIQGQVPDQGIDLPKSVIDAAIIWAVKFDYSAPTPEVRSAFEHWLAQSNLHALAWQRVRSLRTPFTTMPAHLLRSTLDAAQARHEQGRQNRRRGLKLLSVAGLALASSWLMREHTPWQRLLADASTAVGEQKTLRLADGSVVVLNTDSAVSTDLAGDRRLIVLRRGEALVTTGADADAATRLGEKRPFWVCTPFGRLQALGTRFTVRLEDRRARITVQEGAVEAHPVNDAASRVIHPGESAWLTDDGVTTADLLGLVPGAWADGVLEGRNIRLADLLAELNRYRNGRIHCDERVADLRVSGLFHVRNTDQALQFLLQTQPVSITYRTRFWVSVGPEPGG
ncbi:FecR domain-containing protein [Hylemonella sp. W303a]|uniref:FecR domain-containing protein n=1 Tax=Hylemonella sp. W303a TaxID=3389873 RepID=UPI00396B36D6